MTSWVSNPGLFQPICRALGLRGSGQAKWIALIIELGKQRQVVRNEFKVSLVYLVRSSQARQGYPVKPC